MSGARRRTLTLLAALVALLAVAAPAAADVTRTGDTVVIPEGETINDDLDVFAGTTIIRGTVNGDVDAFTGTLIIPGEVTGSVDAFAGTTEIGRGGDGSVGGDVDAFTGSALVDGAVAGDVSVLSGSLVLEDGARVGGDVEATTGSFHRADGAVVQGQVQRQAGPTFGPGPAIPQAAFAAWALALNLVLGAILLLAFPRLTHDVPERVRGDPLRVGGVGLLVLVVAPIVLILLAVTIIGIPITVIGLFLYALALWVGYVYGGYTLGTWLLGYTEVENDWAALALGLVIVAVAGLIPVIGGLLRFIVLLVGLGALAMELRQRWRDRRGRRDVAVAG